MSNFTIVSMRRRIQYYRDRIAELDPPKNQERLSENQYVPIDSCFDRRLVLCVIDGVYYRFDETECWRFAEEPGDDMGWTKCALPVALERFFYREEPDQLM